MIRMPNENNKLFTNMEIVRNLETKNVGQYSRVPEVFPINLVHYLSKSETINIKLVQISNKVH